MAGRGWSSVVGDEVTTGCGWWRQNYGWLWVVVGGGDKIMAGHGLS